jgi:hypothetical protein
MKTNTRSWGLGIVNRRKKSTNVNPHYQRGSVWTEKNNQLLIDTMLRGYDIPKIYLTNSSEDEFEYEVIDGQQRLRAVWGFYNDEYVLGEDSRSLPMGDLFGKKYSELSDDIKDKLAEYELSIVIIEDTDDEEIRDLFLRLQEGKTLNPPEKRNAMVGDMRDFIANLSKDHKVFQVTIPKKDNRNLYADWLSHVVCLELAGGATDMKAQNLKKMYEDNKNFDKNSKHAKNIKKILDFISEAFMVKTQELGIKWGFVDFYLLISLLMKVYILKDKEQNFASFYVGFEGDRRSVEDAAELIDSGDSWSKDLYKYIDAFNKSGGLRKNIETRNNVYTRKLFKEISSLETKDIQRFFDKNQKIVMWRRDGGQCKICHCKVEFDDMHADHIKPHSKGGKTTIENGQTLCAPCNQSKGDK